MFTWFVTYESECYLREYASSSLSVSTKKAFLSRNTTVCVARPRKNDRSCKRDRCINKNAWPQRDYVERLIEMVSSKEKEVYECEGKRSV